MGPGYAALEAQPLPLAQRGHLVPAPTDLLPLSTGAWEQRATPLPAVPRGALPTDAPTQPPWPQNLTPRETKGAGGFAKTNIECSTDAHGGFSQLPASRATSPQSHTSLR